MTINHHPSDETLAAFAAGTLDEGSAFVIATHLSLCAACRDDVKDFECIGGALLSDIEPAQLDASAGGSNVQELARLATAGTTQQPCENSPARMLQLYSQGQWKWLGWGVRSVALDIPVTDGIRVFLLKAAPGTSMPQHTHTGVEWTLVLRGAFAHEFGRFGPGDIEEADGSVDHRPRVEAGEECICLVAMSGMLKLQGITGRLLQPFVRI